MDTTWLKGHQVPIIDPGQTGGNPGINFAPKNQELESSMGTSGQDQGEDIPTRKSELVEIPTSTAREIYKIQGIFPFDFVPDQLIIDEVKISINYRHLLTSVVNNILIKDITDIVYSRNIIFGALSITGGEFKDENGPLTITTLRMYEAMTARRIILGLMIFSDQKVDTTQMSVPDIVKKTSELGKVK